MDAPTTPDPWQEPGADLIEGAMAHLRLIVCPRCHGRGDLPQALFVPCPDCDGSGTKVVAA